ncbi:MAG: hypothetical protein KVP17_002976 [Porospora cf. gigantea B]|uniref:uncharacterized protein n=1 Tax=Porospora cf. gigantea B TaxID=2853592 RepID=UPI003571A707|nr:MAG: hypothetical protein KVP17_002976 [Porospora cf. gigantea B]
MSALRCQQCLTVVANLTKVVKEKVAADPHRVYSYVLDDLLGLEDVPCYSATNPASVRFDLTLFTEAVNVDVSGEMSMVSTWFPNHAWRFVHCNYCHEHIGWNYYKGAPMDKINAVLFAVERVNSLQSSVMCCPSTASCNSDDGSVSSGGHSPLMVMSENTDCDSDDPESRLPHPECVVGDSSEEETVYRPNDGPLPPLEPVEGSAVDLAEVVRLGRLFDPEAVMDGAARIAVLHDLKTNLVQFATNRQPDAEDVSLEGALTISVACRIVIAEGAELGLEPEEQALLAQWTMTPLVRRALIESLHDFVFQDMYSSILRLEQAYNELASAMNLTELAAPAPSIVAQHIANASGAVRVGNACNALDDYCKDILAALPRPTFVGLCVTRLKVQQDSLSDSDSSKATSE